MGSPAAGSAAGLAATSRLHSCLRIWHKVQQLLEQAWQGAWQGYKPLWQAVCLRNVAREVQFSVGKNIHGTYHTPRALFAHAISVSDAVSHCPAKARHIFLVTMTRWFLRAAIHVQSFRSISWYLVFLPNL